MHLATEVSSTTNLQGTLDSVPVMNSSKSSANHTNGSASNVTTNSNTNSHPNNNSNNNSNSNVLTAETLAERTLDSLLAEHPGELTRTGSPHIVSIYMMWSQS